MLLLLLLFYHYLSGLKTIVIQAKTSKFTPEEPQRHIRGSTNEAEWDWGGGAKRVAILHLDSTTASALAFKATTLYTRLSLNEG